MARKRKTINVADLFAESYEILRDQIKRLRGELEKGWDATLMEKLNSLSRTLTVLAAEERKRDAYAEKVVSKMTDEEKTELVKEFISELAPDSRAAIRTLLDSLDEGSVL